MYESALKGKKDARIKSLETLLDVCASMHVVIPGDEAYDVPECEGNPGGLQCSCKGFKHTGICSHVLAMSHTLTKYNVRHQLREMGKKTDKKLKAGPTKRTKALDRIQQCEPDSTATRRRSDLQPLALRASEGKRGKRECAHL